VTRVVETVYDGRDNINQLVIFEGDELVSDLSHVTRIVFTVGGVTVDSDVVDSDTIWWDDQDTYNGTTTDVVKLRLGHQSIPLGTYTDGCLVLFDVVNDDGLVFIDNMKVKVKAGCSGS